jgi:hypothetical protein
MIYRNNPISLCANFFLALFEEKLNKLLDQLNISRISGVLLYRISGRITGSTIRYSPGGRVLKRADYPAGHPGHL